MLLRESLAEFLSSDGFVEIELFSICTITYFAIYANNSSTPSLFLALTSKYSAFKDFANYLPSSGFVTWDISLLYKKVNKSILFATRHKTMLRKKYLDFLVHAWLVIQPTAYNSQKSAFWLHHKWSKLLGSLCSRAWQWLYTFIVLQYPISLVWSASKKFDMNALSPYRLPLRWITSSCRICRGYTWQWDCFYPLPHRRP